jgi:hypothetical protein
MAPKLSKLALTFVVTMPLKVNSKAKGMTMAVIIAARMFTRNRNRIAITNATLSIRFFWTV